ncbi:MAG: carboxypeptidase regulatory-like domain-containing protein [Fidelibacterota bacterium]
MRKLQQHILPLLLSLLFVNILFAGTTGKITGTVTAEADGALLAGANILISGTYLGTSSDVDGHYTILNVPPGEYDLVVSMIGFKKTTVRQVRVEIDLTTIVDVVLPVEVLEGESVEVIAEHKVVKADVAASQLSVTNDEIESLPVTTLGEIVGLKAGITSTLGIRGSGSDQTMLMIDGVTLRDSRNDAPITGIPLSSIQEVSVQTGGFNAEYNNVRGGIINVVSKEGDPQKYSATITTKYSPPAAKHFGDPVFQSESYWLKPFLWDSTAWYGTENGPWDEYDRRQYAPFDGWVAIAAATLSDDDPSNDLTPTAAKRLFEWQHRKDGVIRDPDYTIDLGFGGPVPFISEKLGNLRFYYSRIEEQNMYLFPLATDGRNTYGNVLKITSDLAKNMKLSASTLWNGMTATNASRAGGTSYFYSVAGVAGIVDRTGFTIPWRIFTNDYFSETTRENRTYSLSFSHVLSPTTFYELRWQTTENRYLTGPGRRRNTEKLFEIFPGYQVDEQPFGFMDEFMSSVDGGLTLGGPISTARDSTVVSSFSLSGNYTTQYSTNHQLKTGFEYISYDINMQFGSINKVLPEGNTWAEFSTNPYRFNAYIQDKIEFKGLVAILGLSGEYYDPNGKWFSFDTFDKDFFYYDQDGIWDSKFAKNAKAVKVLNPRLAFSHPITDVSKLYFNYGHYNQSATAEALYRIQRNSVGAIRYLGDPSIDPANTISYELGFDRAIANMYLLRISAYYKDVTNEQDWTQIISSDGKINSYIMTNNLYEDIRGFEIEMSKRFGNWYTGMVNYEYRVSTSGYFDIGKQFQNPAEQTEYEKTNRYQSKPLPTPRAKGYVDIFSPKKFGPALGTVYPLGGWHFNIIGRWTSGSWFTYNPNRIRGIQFNVQWKDYYNFDLKVSKIFAFKQFSVKVFADIFNVLNLKRFSGESFADGYDFDDYMQSLHLPKSVGEKLLYGNIPGNDQPGDYRRDGVEFVPIESVVSLTNVQNPNTRAIYFNQADEIYYQYTGAGWQETETSFLKRVLDDKAYIDMPNQTYFTFLNPRDVFFGLNITYNF